MNHFFVETRIRNFIVQTRSSANNFVTLIYKEDPDDDYWIIPDELLTSDIESLTEDEARKAHETTCDQVRKAITSKPI